MRAVVLALALALAGCASAARVERLERETARLRVEHDATCQRFEEMQLARYGAVAQPCRPTPIVVELEPISASGAVR